MDMTPTVIPKSDQLNTDDLLAGPRTVVVTRVSANESTPDQPVNVFFEGDGGKPYRPCKSMRRVMISVWGADAVNYAGRAMTLYRDPTVTWGGMAVGGIRISHMSHMEREVTLALTASKTNRKPYVVKPLLKQAPAKTAKAEAPATEPDGAPLNAVDYVSTNGDIELIPIDVAIRKMRAAHKSPKLDNQAWFDLFQGNAGWLEERAPDVAKELAVRDQANA